MIVEFIGCTGAGKSTLIEEVQRRLAKTARATTSVELVTGFLGLRCVTNVTLQNLMQEIASLPFVIHSLDRYTGFMQYTIRLFLRNSSFSIRTINNFRSLERKIGMYEIASRYGKDRIILVDEGPILAAHMFIFTGASYTSEEVTRFTGLLPLPDLIVYVRASVDILMERTLRRVDPPREINTKDLAQTERYVKSAVALFDQLAEAENIRCRLLIVESRDFAEPEYGRVVDVITQSILNYRRPARENDK
jgi:deoxyadenosine/deoxycytidine kinase